MERRKSGLGASRRHVFPVRVQRTQQSSVGSSQSYCHCHHVLRWSDLWLWPGIDADRRRQTLRLYNTAMVAIGCHDGISWRRPCAWHRPGNRPHGCKAHTARCYLVARGPCAPDRADTAHVAEHVLRKDDAVDLGNDASRGNGHQPRTGNGYLQERQFCDAIRHLHVSRQPRTCGRIKDLWFDRREFELCAVLHDAQRIYSRDDHRSLVPPAPPRGLRRT